MSIDRTRNCLPDATDKRDKVDIRGKPILAKHGFRIVPSWLSGLLFPLWNIAIIHASSFQMTTMNINMTTYICKFVASYIPEKPLVHVDSSRITIASQSGITLHILNKLIQQNIM